MGDILLWSSRPLRSPEEELWMAVLQQAFHDAKRCDGLNLQAEFYKPNLPDWLQSELQDCEHSRAWLCSPSADLTEVCVLDGVDPSAVLERAKLLFGL
jgi:hypothetical protein